MSQLKIKYADEIKKLLPYECSISFKNSGKHIILVKKKLFTTNIIINPVFLKADKNIIYDIANFILRKNKESLNVSKKNITDFYHQNYIPKKPKIKKKYKCIDIFQVLNELIINLKESYNSVDFNSLQISWGKNYKNQKRSIRFGSFDKRHNLIRIHPRLDSIDIPEYFIRSVIIHEIAHFIAFQLYNNIKPHSRKFHDILKKIDPYLKQGKIWEKKNKHVFFK